MQLTANLEKVVMHHIIQNPAYIKTVQPHYFKSREVQFVYKVVRDTYLESVDRQMPSAVEIYDLCRLADKNEEIHPDVIKAVLRADLSQYRLEMLEKFYQCLQVTNAIKDGLVDSIETLRGVDETNIDSILEAAAKIKARVQDATTPMARDNSLGISFDDPDAHNQDAYANRVETGWHTMDHLMGGGWDRKTLNMLMGETNVGKSVWLTNVAKNAANAGMNVIYITLEMSEKKVMKRLGSMRLGIPIADYDTQSKDAVFMRDRIEALKRRVGSRDDIFGGKLGKIYVKEFPAGTASPDTIEGYVKLWQETMGEQVDMIVIDYLGIMAAPDGTPKDSMYLKGKGVAEGIRAIAQKYNCVIVSATQISKDQWGGSDINLNAIPESKAIAETADSVWAIIRNAQMKIEGRYILKALKLRDSSFEYDRIMFDMNRTTLNIDNDKVVLNAQ